MKFLIAFFLLASPAFAADLTCHVESGQQSLIDSYDLIISGNEYQVTHYGHSRNAYSAPYTLAEHHGTRIGWTGTLVKTQDDSTWKDMPSKLDLRFGATADFLDGPVYMLSGFEDKEVWFTHSSCAATLSLETAAALGDECPVGTKPGHCPSRNCGSCL